MAISLTNHGPETGDRGVGEKDEGHDHRTVFVGHQLTDSNIEAELDGLTQAVDSRSYNQGVDVLSKSTNDDAYESYNIPADEEPSSSEEIRESTENCVSERQSESTRNVEPGNVVAWPNVCVDVCQNVCWKDEKEVGADSRQTESLNSQQNSPSLSSRTLTVMVPMNRGE